MDENFTRCQRSDEEQSAEGGRRAVVLNVGETSVYCVAEKGGDRKDPRAQEQRHREEDAGRRGPRRTRVGRRRGQVWRRGQTPVALP